MHIQVRVEIDELGSGIAFTQWHRGVQLGRLSVSAAPPQVGEDPVSFWRSVLRGRDPCSYIPTSTRGDYTQMVYITDEGDQVSIHHELDSVAEGEADLVTTWTVSRRRWHRAIRAAIRVYQAE